MAKISDEIRELHQQFRDDSNPINWYLLKHEDNDVLSIKGSGTGGYSEFLEALDENSILYGVFRVAAVMQEAETTVSTQFSHKQHNVTRL
jgi:ABC-type histidine transport system ATPase subunit